MHLIKHTLGQGRLSVHVLNNAHGLWGNPATMQLCVDDPLSKTIFYTVTATSWFPFPQPVKRPLSD